MTLALILQATILLAAAHLAALAMRRRSASERHFLWLAAMIGLAVLPLVERASLPPIPAPSIAPVQAAVAPVVNTTPAVAGKQQWTIADLWLPVAAAIAVYPLLGMAAVWTRRRRPAPASIQATADELSPRRNVRVQVSDACRFPMTWGAWPATILLPAEAAEWTAERLRVVLLHELAHIDRHDWVAQIGSRLVCAAYWFHPLAWLALAAMRRDSEQACDDAVLARGERASDYAGHLLALAGRDSAIALPMADRSHLAARIEAALDGGIRRNAPSMAWKGALVALCLAALWPLAPAQSGGGRLYGSVGDPSSARIPNVSITVSLEGGARKEVVTSGPDGSYVIPQLPAGTYTIEARSPGFAVFTRKGIAIKDGDSQQLDVNLDMGRLKESVTVIGKRPAAPVPAQAGPPRRIRVGGNVQATKLLYQPKPSYPDHLQQQGIEGTVLLEGVISTDGSLISVRSINSLVHPELTRAAIAAVGLWRYQPTLLNGQPVEIITTIDVTYRLER